MTAVNKGFRTRAQLQMRSPRSVSYNITPGAGGTAGHWNGGPVGITAAMDHAKCEVHWRADQDYHMDGHGWVDIAYTGGFCQHGICMAGRGFGVRTAANGTDVGNQNYYAYCWIGGTGETPTVDALNAFEWWVNEARRAGKAGMRVVPHSSLFSTACPGDNVRTECTTIDNRQLTVGVPTLPPSTPVTPDPFQEDDMLALILWAYIELVGRTNPPSTDEVTNWVTGTPGWTSAQTLAAFLDSRCEPGGVVKAYKDILGRAPESQAVIDGHLATKPTIRQVRYDLSISAEAKLRAGK